MFIPVFCFGSQEVKERIPNCKVMLKDSSCGAFSDFLQCLVKDLNEHK